MTLTDEELFECDKGLLAGVVPPTDADPSVAQERLLWLTRSMGTVVHVAISHVRWESEPFYFTHFIVKELTHYEQTRVAIACAKAVVHLVQKGKETAARIAIEAAEAWCKEPSEERRRAARISGEMINSECDASRAAYNAVCTVNNIDYHHGNSPISTAYTAYYASHAIHRARYADISLNIRAVVLQAAIEWGKLRT